MTKYELLQQRLKVRGGHFQTGWVLHHNLTVGSIEYGYVNSQVRPVKNAQPNDAPHAVVRLLGGAQTGCFETSNFNDDERAQFIELIGGAVKRMQTEVEAIQRKIAAVDELLG